VNKLYPIKELSIKLKLSIAAIKYNIKVGNLDTTKHSFMKTNAPLIINNKKAQKIIKKHLNLQEGRKVCTKCNIAKSKKSFYSKGSWCKKCSRLVSKKYRQDHKKRLKELAEKKKTPEAMEKQKKYMKKYDRKKYETSKKGVQKRKDYYSNPEKKEFRKKYHLAYALTDIDLKRQLNKIGLPTTQEMIELKRVQIQLKREIKNESTNTQRTT